MSSGKLGRVNFRLLIALLICLSPGLAHADQAAERQAELDALQRRLQALQKEFRSTQVHRKEAADELRESERAISEAVRKLRALDAERRRARTELEVLGERMDAAGVRISEQQARLGQALRAAYRRGQGDALKILLNGDDPNQSARELRYLAHLSRAQRAGIDALRAELTGLAELQQQAGQKSSELARLKTAREAEQQRLLGEKQARERVLQALSTQIQQQRREISTLKRDERNLTRLVERLNRLMAERAAREAAQARAAQQAKQKRADGKPAAASERPPLAVNTETPVAFRSDRPFSRLKGSLHLPVAGELMNRFGAPREDGGVSWKGLFIRAAQGSAVKAIAAGQVVFAEWLRGFGNLIIVDHGEGYMSLYSNNESLYKQVGERVQPGDAIAAVGNSGGQTDTGLYFEMRHQSRPMNPLLWVK